MGDIAFAAGPRPAAGAQDQAGTPLSRLATALKPITDQLNMPRSTVLMLLGELEARKALRLDPPEADRVLPAELVLALEKAGLRIVRT